MKYLNIIVEGSTEENFINEVMIKHFASLNIFISARKIRTGWDKTANKPAKGGLLKYSKFKNDVTRWIESEKDRKDTFYTSFIDLYAFPKDYESPYKENIQIINDPYLKVKTLEKAIFHDINYPRFIPYVQLHEFESLILVDPDKLLLMYPQYENAISKLKDEILNKNPEEINESYLTAPSKRIIKYLPIYEGQKAQVGPLVAEEIGITELRNKCSHFNEWITVLEGL
ncbi:DUF4276 family protein [Flavobacterium filum]|uniref:DUF4276 family protein n=1 Tax=Flavobacterium filum TaxID=370974 RepID=UPI00047C214B|nr:DUF4276 family protein [Flavobacterium filum]